MCYSEQYVEITSQNVDSFIVAWMKVVYYTEIYVEVTAKQVDSGIVAWMECVTVNIMWKILKSWWAVVLQQDEVYYSEHYVKYLDHETSTIIKDAYFLILNFALCCVCYILQNINATATRYL